MLLEGTKGQPGEVEDDQMDDDLANDMSIEGKIEREILKHLAHTEGRFN